MDGRDKAERGRHGGGSRMLRAHNLSLKPKAEKANWKQVRSLTFTSHPPEQLNRLNLPKQHHQWGLMFKYPRIWRDIPHSDHCRGGGREI